MITRRLLGQSWLVLAVILSGASAAHAQQGVALSRLEPSERGSRFFVADSLELDAAGRRPRIAAGIVSTYANRARTFGTDAEGERSRLSEHALYLHPGGSITIEPGARFALDVPVALVQSGENTNLAGNFYGAPESPRLGDVRASFDLRIATVGIVTMAGGVSAYLPTGSEAALASDGHARFALRFGASVRAGPILAAARLGYMYRRDAAFGGVDLGSEANAVLAVGYATGAWTIGPELHGATILGAFGRTTHTPVEGLVGAHLAIGDFRAGAGIGTGLVSGLGASHVRLLVSLEWAPRPAVSDRDRDGVSDGEDACPDVPGTVRGCPASPGDADHDGIPDGDDACPDLPGTRTRDPMTHGCPDADNDGVPDPIDACPNVFGEPSAVPRFHGCPEDTDGDEVPDRQDACPDEAGIRTDDLATNGCPAARSAPADRDGDKVADAEDACPGEAGVATEDAATNGCPLARRDGDRIVLALPIAFEAGRSALAAESAATLSAIAELLRAQADIARLRIVGQLQDRGDRPRTLRAAQQRAQAIVDRLVQLGVARGRLEATGNVADNADTILTIQAAPAKPK